MELRILKSAVRKAGGPKKVAQAVGLSRQSIYFYVTGKREPNDAFLGYIGVKRVVKYKSEKRKARK
jgi:hypothetical protein